MFQISNLDELGRTGACESTCIEEKIQQHDPAIVGLPDFVTSRRSDIFLEMFLHTLEGETIVMTMLKFLCPALYREFGFELKEGESSHFNHF
jgi:hypothetical protein